MVKMNTNNYNTICTAPREDAAPEKDVADPPVQKHVNIKDTGNN